MSILPGKRRLSHENDEIKELYRKFYGKPLSKLSEDMLHTSYGDKSGQLDGKFQVMQNKYNRLGCGFTLSVNLTA